MIYDKSANSIYTAYDKNTVELSNAYDINGDSVFYDNSLIVMTYNVQDWNGINAQTAMQHEIFNLYNADIIGLQEYTSDGSTPSVAEDALSNYDYVYMTYHKNFNGIASKHRLDDLFIADYTTQDPYDASKYNETRAYMRGYFNIGSKRIAFFNTHLCVHNAAPRYAQMQELFELAEEEEYVIITGDFNSTMRPLTAESDDYIYQYKPFVDAGYHLANNSPASGFTNTHSSATSVESLTDLESALDTIIVSGNISINRVVFDPTKLSFQNGDKFDHIPVIAHLTIN